MSTKTASILNRPITRCLALGALALSTHNASATMILYETRNNTTAVNSADYRASWNTQTSAINSAVLDAFDRDTAPGSYFHSHLRVEFDWLDASQDWLFQFAPDAGFGGAIYANGALVEANSTDLWWGYRWGNAHDILEATSADFALGANVLDLYWAEACCNGGQSGRFSVNGGADWMTLSVANLQSVAVPEPGMLSLMAGGLVGFGVNRRRKKAQRNAG